MVYKAAAATCPGKKKSYNSNNFYLNSKYITEEYCSSQVLLTQKREQKGLQLYAVSEGYGADLYQDEASLIETMARAGFRYDPERNAFV